MKIRIKLLLMKEIARRNEEHIDAWKKRNSPSQPIQNKPKRNKGKAKKREE